MEATGESVRFSIFLQYFYVFIICITLLYNYFCYILNITEVICKVHHATELTITLREVILDLSIHLPSFETRFLFSFATHFLYLRNLY